VLGVINIGRGFAVHGGYANPRTARFYLRYLSTCKFWYPGWWRRGHGALELILLRYQADWICLEKAIYCENFY
jgi:hypothetical protein